MRDAADREKMKKSFSDCGKIFIAIGDETRQRIMMLLIDAGYDGMSVGEITRTTHLSRPAVSHHLKILKDAEIIRVRSEGTKNICYIDPGSRIEDLRKLFSEIEEYIRIIDETKGRGREKNEENI